MNDTMYSIPPDEMSKIKALNADSLKHGTPKCSCAIYDKRPSFCQQGPALMTRMPDCGFTFWYNVSIGGVERNGKCRQCGRCCAMPRKNGDPYGMFDPTGKPCKHLIVEAK